MSLQPGDIISTGTPPGVGMDEPQVLKPGDEMKLGIEGLGEQTQKTISAMFGSINNCHNVKDFRKLAKEGFRPIFHYIDGAADDEITYRRNTEALINVILFQMY